jgi:predicted small metal-binding protein
MEAFVPEVATAQNRSRTADAERSLNLGARRADVHCTDRRRKRADMKQFACGDVVPGCQARFVCSTEEEILAEVAAHAAADHDLVTIPPELVEQVRGHILAMA